MVKIRRQKTRPNTLVSAASARGERWRTRSIAWDGRVHVKSNVIRAIVVRRRHRVRYYVIRDVFDIYKYFDAIDLRCYVIREAIVI